MAYKVSQGSRGFGDIKFESDVDTGIDFEDDMVALQTNGNNIFKVSGSHAYLAGGSNLYLEGNSAIFFDADDPSIDVFATESGTNNLKLDGNNSIILVGDERVNIQENTTVKASFDFNNNKFNLEMPMHIDLTEPTIFFKEGGSDRAEIGINDSDNLLITNQSTNKFIVFKTNDAGNIREGLRIGGTVPEVVVNEGSDSLVDFRVESDNNTHALFVEGGTDRVGIGVSSPAYELEVSGNVYLSGSLSHGDVMLLELSVPGVDLQTDTYAHRIYAPYNIDVDNVMYVLDSHTASGDVTVTLTNTTSNTAMSTVTMAGTSLTGSDFSITSPSVAQGDALTFAITNAAGTSQGLHAMLYFRRSI